MRKDNVQLFSRKPIIFRLFGSKPSLFIFTSTVLAYVIAILYESTFLAAFDIGPDLIEISPVVIFYSIISLVVAYGILELYIQLHHYFLHKTDEARGHTYKRLLYESLDTLAHMLYLTGILAIVSGTITAKNVSIKNLVFTVSLSIGVVLLLFAVRILIGFKALVKTGSITKSLEAFNKLLDKHNKKVEKNDATSKKEINEGVLAYLYLGMFLFFIPIMAATSTARSEQSYYVWSSSGHIKSVVIRHYNGRAVIKDYDTRENKFLDGFTLANTEEQRVFKEKVIVQEQDHN